LRLEASDRKKRIRIGKAGGNIREKRGCAGAGGKGRGSCFFGKRPVLKTKKETARGTKVFFR